MRGVPPHRHTAGGFIQLRRRRERRWQRGRREQLRRGDSSTRLPAFWRDGTPLRPLGVFTAAGGTRSEADGVSYDGEVVVGTGDTSGGERAFRWTSTRGIASLGTLPAAPFSEASGVNAAGSVVVGTSDMRAFVWSSEGMSEIVGFGDAHAVSADGNRVAGNGAGRVGDTIGNNEAMLWTAETGQVLELGAFDDDTATFARGMSADGLTVVGASGIDGLNCFRWHDNTLEYLEGMRFATDANRDGSIVVGAAPPVAGSACAGPMFAAAMWRPEQGLQFVACEVLPAGLIPMGWVLEFANAISDDGRVIAGDGRNPAGSPEGWVAVLGPDCAAP